MSTPVKIPGFAEIRAHGPTVARSLTLQRLLRDAGYSTGTRDVSSAGIRLVSTLAKQHGLRDWPNTRGIADYDALIDVVRDHLVSVGRIDPNEDEEYQKFVSEMVHHCRCRSNNVPCDGVLAGGPCDQVQEESPIESHDDDESGI